MLKRILLSVLSFTTACSLTDPPSDFVSELKTERTSAVDSTPPFVKLVYPNKSFGVDTHFTISNIAYDDVKLDRVEVSYDGKNWFRCSSSGPSNFFYEFKGVPEGVKLVRVRAVDWAGNSSEDSKKFVVSGGVYVATNGRDSVQVPSKEMPFKSIEKAVAYAVVNGKSDIFVSGGVYRASKSGFAFIELFGGLRIWGGYSSDFSERNPDVYRTVFDGNGRVCYVVVVSGITDNAPMIDGVIIMGAISNDFGNGSGIFVSQSKLALKDVSVVSNGAVYSGAGIFLLNSTLYATNLSVGFNQTYQSSGTEPLCGGGGMLIANSQLVGLNVRVFSNSSAQKGGGIFITNGTISVDALEVFGNNAPSGGGIYISVGGPVFDFRGGFIFDNSAGPFGSGGGLGIEVYDSKAYILNVIVSNNRVSSFSEGGGVKVAGTNAVFSNAVITCNFADYSGGGVSSFKGLEFYDSIITFNTSSNNQSGGGVYVNPSQTETVFSNCVILNNYVGGYGGGFYSGDVVVMSSIIASNCSQQYGGGFYSYGSVVLNNSAVVSNYAGADGGGVWVYDDFSATNSSIATNTAGSSGGGIFTNSGTALSLSSINMSQNVPSDFN